MKIYISGKITDTEDYVDRFNEAERQLKEIYPESEIENPVTFGKEVEEQVINPEWKDYMKNCIVHLLDCDAIYLMEGWQNSKGARLEYFIASCLDIKFIEI